MEGLHQSGSTSISDQDLRNGGSPNKDVKAVGKEKRERNFQEVRKKIETKMGERWKSREKKKKNQLANEQC